MKEKLKVDKKKILNTATVAEEKAKKTFDEYKKFAIKGNVLDLAIGVVIGAAFTNIVNTLVSSLVTPLLSVLTNKVDLGSLFISLTGGSYLTMEEAKAAGEIVVNYGAIVNSVLNFFIVSFILFLVVRSFTRLKVKEEKTAEDKTKAETQTCPYCKTSIHIEATKCPNCTSDLK